MGLSVTTGVPGVAQARGSDVVPPAFHSGAFPSCSSPRRRPRVCRFSHFHTFQELWSFAQEKAVVILSWQGPRTQLSLDACGRVVRPGLLEAGAPSMVTCICHLPTLSHLLSLTIHFTKLCAFPRTLP